MTISRCFRPLFAGAVLAILSGCAQTYPPLYTPPAAPLVAGHSNLEEILHTAATTQETYRKYYRDTAEAADITQLPLIGAASLAAGVLYSGGGNAQDHLAGIGIGAAGYSAYRDVLLPGGLPELYIKGHSALGCIRLEGLRFTGSSATTKFNTITQLAQQQSARIVISQQLYGTSNLSASANSTTKSQFQAASSSLNSSINSATEEMKNTLRQLASFENAETIFGTSVSNVQFKVALAARSNRTVEFSDLRKAITANITDAGGPPPPPPLARVAVKPDAQVISDVISASVTLTQKTEELRAKTPKYVEALERVATCSNIIS